MRDSTRKNILRAVCISLCLLCLFGYLLSSGTTVDSQDAAKREILQNHTKQTGAENAVTSIYLNYRLWDTLFEALVLMLSALAVISFSWSKG